MSPRPVAIVVPSLNSLATLPICIRSARALAGTNNYEIVVVDGGSTDGSIEWLERQRGVRLLRCSGGGAAALNLAIAETGKADLVRLHADVVVETQDWLAKLAAAAERSPSAGIVGAKLVFPDDRVESIGRSIVAGFGMIARHANLRCFEPDSPKWGSEAREVDSTASAFCYIRREALDAAGGYDPAFGIQQMGHDDLCVSARRAGCKVYAHAGVKAVHYTDAWTPTTRLHLLEPEGHLARAKQCKETITAELATVWEEKWGWNPYTPDLGRIRRLYGETEIAWRIGEPMRFKPKEWPPRVDAVLVTWNNKNILRRCLESLANTNYEKIEVHVVDNGSADGTQEYLESLEGKYRYPLHIHRMAVNTGVAVGMNWGISKGNGEIVARLDDDVVLPPEWLNGLLQEFRRRPFAGCVGPKILHDNDRRDVQCGPYRLFPSLFGHDNEPDAGQADYRSRCVHVRGCCNLYRRDVLNACGLFDLRFSPSQVDDPDHHAALQASGYEIIYNGHVAVVHMQTNGAARSFAAQSNLAANNAKLFGKWGEDVWKVLDTAIDLSEEGRYLPDALSLGEARGETPSLETPEQFPKPTRLAAASAEAVRLAARFRELVLQPTGPLKLYFDDYVAFGRSLLRDGKIPESLSVLHSVVDLAPKRFDALVALAEGYQQSGQAARATALLARAESFCETQPSLLDPIATIRRAIREAGTAAAAAAKPPAPALPADQSHRIGETQHSVSMGGASRRGPRVLLLNTFERRTPGGDMVQVKKTAEYLAQHGCEVDVRYAAAVDPTPYDLVHVVNLWFPQQTLPQVKAIRRAKPNIPIVLTPIYWDMSEKHWADGAVPSIFAKSKSPADLRTNLAALADGSLVSAGRRRAEAGEPNFAGYEHYQRCILELVDHLLPQSELEMENMARTLGLSPPHTVVRNAAEPALFDAATAAPFIEKYGVRDFVLTAGLVENRKNQLLLLHALRGSGVPVVVSGRNYDRNYLRLCRAAGDPSTIFLEHLTHEELASAMKAARIFALPSWMECASFAEIEAALAGCSLVVSDRTSEREYFGDAAYYCDPANVASIRAAVTTAMQRHSADAPKRAALREKFLRECTWENAALATLAGYRAAFRARGQTWVWDASDAVLGAEPVFAGV
jgi:GT2 family glycosyltransferase/glycosyltransferase involved in cell wall biosynthesis